MPLYHLRSENRLCCSCITTKQFNALFDSSLSKKPRLKINAGGYHSLIQNEDIENLNKVEEKIIAEKYSRAQSHHKGFKNSLAELIEKL